MTTENISATSNSDFVDVSIVICTRDRASYLRETLASLAEIYVPPEYKVELLIVDNDSRDHTQDVIQKRRPGQFKTRMIREENVGLSHARNTAVTHARGKILLFTDDDVRVPSDWVVKMAEPIRKGEADAVAGAVALAPHLTRSWQLEHPWLTSPLATTHALTPENPSRMVGANMAISRHVLDSIPKFDLELDPGSSLGLGGETLYTLRLKKAGFRLASAFDVVVEHHCDESRLTRESYLEYVKKVGRSQGYIDYHWKHRTVRPFSLLSQLLWKGMKLLAGRQIRYNEVQHPEGLPRWEMVLLTQIYHRLQLLVESGRPRKYTPGTEGG